MPVPFLVRAAHLHLAERHVEEGVEIEQMARHPLAVLQLYCLCAIDQHYSRV